jgi:hypothetical protein
MADEVQFVYATQVVLEDSGAVTASDVFTKADDVSLSNANHSDYPLGDFVLAAAFAGTPGAYGNVNLYRRDLNIDSTNDAPAPSANYKGTFVGSFIIESAATASNKQYYPLKDVPLSKECEFYIENKTDQSMNAGWDLKVTPKTYKPAA